MKRDATFNRQLNANKAVANLIAIIQQLTANVNAAQNDLPTYEQAHKDAVSNYDSCNAEVYNFADQKARIENAIKDRQDSINTANDGIRAASDAVKDL